MPSLESKSSVQANNKGAPLASSFESNSAFVNHAIGHWPANNTATSCNSNGHGTQYYHAQQNSTKPNYNNQSDELYKTNEAIPHGINGSGAISASVSCSSRSPLMIRDDEPVTYNHNHLAASCSKSSSALPACYLLQACNGNSLEQPYQQYPMSNNNQKNNTHLSIKSNRQVTAKEDYRSSLISLDPTDLTRPLFCYTLQLGKCTVLKLKKILCTCFHHIIKSTNK